MAKHSTPQQREAAVARIAAGECARKVAEDTGFKAGTIRNWCWYRGVPCSMKSPRKTVRDRAYRILADLLNTDQTYQAVGDRHGVSRQYVYEIAVKARKAGIQVPRHSREEKTDG